MLAAAAVVFIAKGGKGSAATAPNNVKQQAAELEALKSAALHDAAGAKAALDSAESAAAPAFVLDSLRQVLADANLRAAGADESLKRKRR